MPEQGAGNITRVELPDVMPARHPGLEVAEFDSALVVFGADANQVHLLQQVHALVFDSCDGSTPRAAVAGELVDAGVGPEADVDELVSSVLDDLARLGLLEGATPSKPPPCIGCGGDVAASRRRRRLSRR